MVSPFWNGLLRPDSPSNLPGGGRLQECYKVAHFHAEIEHDDLSQQPTRDITTPVNRYRSLASIKVLEAPMRSATAGLNEAQVTKNSH